MCIAFDGAYIFEAPPADPGSTDEYRELAPEIMPASGEGSGAAGVALPDVTAGPGMRRRAAPAVKH
jgi:hypothetical protein